MKKTIGFHAAIVTQRKEGGEWVGEQQIVANDPTVKNKSLAMAKAKDAASRLKKRNGDGIYEWVEVYRHTLDVYIEDGQKIYDTNQEVIESINPK